MRLLKLNFKYIALFLFGLFFAIISYLVYSNNVLNDYSVNNADRSIQLGFWTEGLWNDAEKKLHINELKDLERKVGKKASIAHFFRGWGYLDEESLTQDLNTLIDNGWRPMLSANPYFFDDCKASGKNIYQAISEGDCDDFIRSSGRNLRNVKGDFFLRFAWEANLPSIEWSVPSTGSTAEYYIYAWRRLHRIMREEGATNIIWVFAPQVETNDSLNFNALYPGDEYVDWIALDGYNWGNTQEWGSWQSFSSVFFPSYIMITSYAPSKPLMISEVNTSGVGGNKADWYKQMLTKELISVFPKVDAVVFFNEDKRETENVNWHIDETDETLESFRRSIKSTVYKSSF